MQMQEENSKGNAVRGEFSSDVTDITVPPEPEKCVSSPSGDLCSENPVRESQETSVSLQEPSSPEMLPEKEGKASIVPLEKTENRTEVSASASTQKIDTKALLQFPSGSTLPPSPRPQEEKISPVFRKKVENIRFPNAMEGRPYSHSVLLSEFTEETSVQKISFVGLDKGDTGLSVENKDGAILLSGTPLRSGNLTVWIEYTAESVLGIAKTLRVEFPSILIFPDPRTLWKDLPPNPDAPYPSPGEASYFRSGISGKTIVAASKRGRSHANEGKFRDDNFSIAWLEETGWLIVAVSDGAGAAEFSREGSRIVCQTFTDCLSEKLSSEDTNRKLELIPERKGQEMALERLLFETVHHGMKEIQAEAIRNRVPSKKFAATFLGYVAKKFGDGWLIVSIGIGDGAIAMVDSEDTLFLLNEPDGGEYAGQTRFITSSDVWQSGGTKRTFSVRVKDFKYLFSMSDGISDPKFETENNLRNLDKWHDLWHDLNASGDSPVHFDRREEEIQNELLAWLDFWSKGYHDDRTITVFY